MKRRRFRTTYFEIPRIPPLKNGGLIEALDESAQIHGRALQILNESRRFGAEAPIIRRSSGATDLFSLRRCSRHLARSSAPHASPCEDLPQHSIAVSPVSRSRANRSRTITFRSLDISKGGPAREGSEGSQVVARAAGSPAHCLASLASPNRLISDDAG